MGSVVSAVAFPRPMRQYSAQQLQSRQDLVFLKAGEGKLRIPVVHVQRDAAMTILYSHGNAEDVGLALPYIDQLSRDCNVNVLAYEYPGYSIAEGEPSEENCYSAITAACDYLTQQCKLPRNCIIPFGRSLGSGPTVDLCMKHSDFGGMIMQSPLESGMRVGLGNAAFLLKPFDLFRNCDKIQFIRCPTLIIHGTADGVVPCEHGRWLHQELLRVHPQVRHEAMWVRGRGHNDMPEEACLERIGEFLRVIEGDNNSSNNNNSNNNNNNNNSSNNNKNNNSGSNANNNQWKRQQQRGK